MWVSVTGRGSWDGTLNSPGARWRLTRAQFSISINISKSGEKKNCPGTILSHGYLPYSVASDSKPLETICGLGTVVPPRRAIAANSAPEGEKVRNVRLRKQFLFTKS